MACGMVKIVACGRVEGVLCGGRAESSSVARGGKVRWRREVCVAGLPA